MPRATASYARHRYPKSVIAHAAGLYDRFSLSLRDVEDVLAQRGVEVSSMGTKSSQSR